MGEPCSTQLAVTSDALPASTPIRISEIKIDFEGNMKPIILRHSKTPQDIKNQRVILTKVALNDVLESTESSSGTGSMQNGRPILSGTDDLTFWPGKTRVFEFGCLLREAGEASAVSATFSIASQLFDLDFIQKFEISASPDLWWGEKSARKKLNRDNASSIAIHPKPPKVELRFIGFQDHYYTNENIKLRLEVVNGEDVDSITSLDALLLGDVAPTLTLKLAAGLQNENGDSDGNNAPPGFLVGRIATAASSIVEVLIPPIDLPATYDLSLKASYHLVSDLETTIYRSTSIQLAVINPFEANYDFSPRIHPDPWPSIFSHDEGEDLEKTPPTMAHGLAQKWCLTSRYFSFAAEDLIVEDLSVDVIGTNGSIQCSTQKVTAIPEGGIRVAPKSLEEAEFDVFTQKNSLDDRGTATLDVSLAIKWRRDEERSTLNTTVLAVPRLLVSSSEPRVLGGVSYSATIPSMVHFDVIIENPSNHFLTFGITMEPSEKFAFSGVKSSTLQLVPLSRRTMTFRLLPYTRGDWIGPIRCVIRDKYFQKILKIAPTEAMKSEKEGLFIWVPPEEEL